MNHRNLFHRRAVCGLSWLFLVGLFLALTGVHSAPAKRAVVYDDLPAELRPWLERQRIQRDEFAARIAEINRRTEERELQGEYDHLIFYLLQSSRFTAQPPIEPALSAYQFVQGLSDAERARFLAEDERFQLAGEKISQAVKTRIADFLKAAKKESADERLSYFAGLLAKTASPELSAARRLQAEYFRAMKFLYRKEFASRSVKPAEVAAFVASLYQERGHSTDTQIEANFAVHTALAALKAQHPETKFSRVLIVGPGMDFAPRTDLIDLFGPQSYQPFAIADSLLALKLAEGSRLKIHCVDINDRVLAHLQSLGARKEVSLSILSGVKDSAARPLTEDFKDYFRGFGQSIGVESSLDVPARFAGHLKKSLRLRPEVVSAVSAGRLNIVTERYQDSPQYDLVIVTNVFPYFSAPELLFALTNIQAMTAEGGYLIHNELQTVPSNFVNVLGLPLRQARTVMIASDSAAPLFDGVAIHQKIPRS